MAFSSVPRSLALIPDGNRRWAKAHRLSMMEGYDKGVKKFLDFSEWCKSYGVRNITVWALSSENIRRSPGEVKALFGIYRRVCKDREIIERLQREGVRLNIISNKKLLPQDLNRALADLASKTRENKERVINMLIGYGGKDDLIFAAKKAVGLAKKGVNLDANRFTECLLSNEVPDIDFIIRTSGEKRLSGFIPWQAAYSELYFSSKLWPDFSRHDLYNALSEYQSRERRFGR
jgi:undecaprenyl diphosphate synthase